MSDRLALFAHVMDGNSFLVVPAPKNETDPWLVPDPTSVEQYYTETKSAPALSALKQMMRAYADGDGFNFSSGARQFRENLRALSPSIYPTESKLRIEYFYNHFDGFYRAAWCYGIALVILIAAHLRKRGGWLRHAGVALAVAGLLFHASAIAMRCMIAGRPPVTNMYESIIWVSFAVSFFGMIFFARYRTTVYLLAALPVTLIALLLVHQMPIAMPSSIDPLVPVLRDNFWLTIHVLTITLSYAAFALAMGFGHILLVPLRAKPNQCARRSTDAFLVVSRFAARRAVARCRHNSRRRLGELFLGSILGLGSEGNMGAHRAALLHHDIARPSRRLVDAIRFGRCERCLFSRRFDGVVWA